MTLNFSSHLRISAFALLAALTVTAQADFKIVSHQHTKSDMEGQKDQDETVTSYFKKGFVREDSTDGTIRITDPKARKTYVLHPKTKEYSELGMDSTMGKMKVTTSVHVKPTNKKKVIVGKTSGLYLVDMIIDMQMPGISAGSPSLGSVHVIVNMNQWMTTAMKDKLTPSDTMEAMGQMLSGLGSMGVDTAKLKKEFAKVKGVPLDMDVTIKGEMKWSKDAPNMGDAAPKGFNMTVTSQVKSVSEAPLSADLFKIPAGYKKRTPGMRGRGMNSGD